MNKLGIYVHIPFCESKCKYCNFISGIFSQDIQKRYVSALIEEIKREKVETKVASIFFGGGTPSILTAEAIGKIMHAIKENFNLAKNAEISIECNPNSVTKEKLKSYISLGFNRISFGVQSLDDEVLMLIGRVHNKAQALQTIKLARSVGFKNINADLLLGIKENKNISNDIIELKTAGVTHISAYMLILEPNTPLFNEAKQNKVKLLSDDESVAQYENYLKVLRQNGFYRYEISNFALKGYKCKHNLNYWECGEYLGFGVSAHSYINGVRYSNTENISEYLKNSKYKNYEKLTKQEKLEELIMLGLRTKRGVSLKKLEVFGYKVLENKNALKMLSLGLIKMNSTHLYITSKNFGIANQIILKLVE